MDPQNTPVRATRATVGQQLQSLAERLDRERQKVREAIVRLSQGTLSQTALTKVTSGAAALADDLSELNMSLLMQRSGH